MASGCLISSDMTHSAVDEIVSVPAMNKSYTYIIDRKTNSNQNDNFARKNILISYPLFF
jgi:hypothetical protein